MSGREGFVGRLAGHQYEGDSWGRQYQRIYTGEATRDDNLTPAYVTPLVEGEPVPGETGWRWQGEDVEIMTLPYDHEGDRRVVVAQSGRAYMPLVSDLTRAPETREVEVVIHESRERFSSTACLMRVPAGTPRKDLMAAIRTAVEVGTDG